MNTVQLRPGIKNNPSSSRASGEKERGQGVAVPVGGQSGH